VGGRELLEQDKGQKGEGGVFSGSNEVVAERALMHLHYAWQSHYNTQQITFGGNSRLHAC
jgi:hypothetical protein